MSLIPSLSSGGDLQRAGLPLSEEEKTDLQVGQVASQILDDWVMVEHQQPNLEERLIGRRDDLWSWYLREIPSFSARMQVWIAGLGLLPTGLWAIPAGLLTFEVGNVAYGITRESIDRLGIIALDQVEGVKQALGIEHRKEDLILAQERSQEIQAWILEATKGEEPLTEEAMRIFKKRPSLKREESERIVEFLRNHRAHFPAETLENMITCFDWEFLENPKSITDEMAFCYWLFLYKDHPERNQHVLKHFQSGGPFIPIVLSVALEWAKAQSVEVEVCLKELSLQLSLTPEKLEYALPLPTLTLDDSQEVTEELIKKLVPNWEKIHPMEVLTREEVQKYPNELPFLRLIKKTLDNLDVPIGRQLYYDLLKTFCTYFNALPEQSKNAFHLSACTTLVVLSQIEQDKTLYLPPLFPSFRNNLPHILFEMGQALYYSREVEYPPKIKPPFRGVWKNGPKLSMGASNEGKTFLFYPLFQLPNSDETVIYDILNQTLVLRRL